MPFRRPTKPTCDAAADAPVAAGVVFVAPDGDVLLLRRASTEQNYGGHWGLPGGKAEDGETAQDAAAREFKEECGLDIDMAAGLKLLAKTATPNGMVFSTFAKPTEDKFVPALDGEHSGYCWASLDMLPRPLHPSVERCLGADIGAKAAADMTPEDWTELRDGFSKWTREEEREPEHAQDSRLAMDRRLYDAKGKRIMGHDVMALDRAASSRTYDADGHLHLARTPISKANVCEYYGHEIPDADKLGLDPQRKYRLLRDPEELAKAAKSSNGKKLMLGHVPVSADDPQKDQQVGATGDNAEFDGTYLYNSLHVHDREGIDAIEKADKAKEAQDSDEEDRGAKELSSAYRYRMDPTPGVFKGEPYDGVMRDIDFNHVALVPEGRAGADVVVGDSQIEKESNMKKVLTRFAAASVGALSVYLQPKMAADAKIDLTAIFAGVTKKNFASKKAKLATDIKAKVKLAADANVDDMHDFIDRLDKTDVAEGADEDPSSGLPMSAADMEAKAKDEAEAKEKEEKEAKDKKAADKKSARDAFLTGKGMKAEDIAALDEMEEAEDEESEEAEESAEGKEGAGAKEGAKDGEEPPVTKKAMDAALKKTAEDTATRVRKEMIEVAEAREFVAPWAGKLSLALDSAEAIYRTALDSLGVKHKGMHKDALKPVLEAQPKPGEQNRRIAQDGAHARDTSGFESRWGNGGNA